MSIKGLLLGAIVIVVLDVIVSLGLAMGMGAGDLSAGMTQEQITAATEALTMTTGYLVGSLVGGTLATMVGGYVAARVAYGAPYLNAGLLGVAGTLLSIALVQDGAPQWFRFGGIAAVLPAALLGGLLAARKA